MKKKPGRPTTLTEAVVTRLEQRITTGVTVRAACRSLRIPYQTVMNRRAVDAALRERLARAYVLGAEAALDEAEDRLRMATSRTIMVVRELAHHARWKASKLLSAYKAELPGNVLVVPPTPLSGDVDRGAMFRIARKVALATNMAGLIDGRNPLELAACLCKLGEDDRRRLGEEVDRLQRERAASAPRLPAPPGAAVVDVEARRAP